MLSLTDKAWSPYAAGVVIGLLQIPAFLLADTALGASSSFVSVAGYMASVFDPAVREMDYFAKYMTSTKYAWQSALVVGIALGALLSTRLAKTRRPRMSPLWRAALPVSGFGGRAAMAFAGGFVMLFGARMAGGCTSGHGISGIGQLAVGSILTIAAMFAGGIAVAMMYRKV
ncbi:YeeE/YedE thiosulfate transporter family protein [Caenispirillum salinarum]|uniref:YeeE/YedE thiosulfate transporter family protein n=1 Tax=Caenispirillum salinarum TaxID=859058 RepID=UPI00384BB388